MIDQVYCDVILQLNISNHEYTNICWGELNVLFVSRHADLTGRTLTSQGSVMRVLGALWRHPMETFSALLAICAGNSPVPGEFPSQRPVARSFDVFVDLRLNKRFSKQSRRWWFEKASHSLWRHCNATAECLRQFPRLPRLRPSQDKLMEAYWCHGVQKIGIS